MARISGINLAPAKRIEAALLAVAGVGQSLAITICEAANVDVNKKAKDLTSEEEARLRNEVAKYPTEGDLRRLVSQNVKLLQDIGSYRGERHRRRLPCRGQKTKTNARTRKGKKTTMGSGRRKETKK